MALLSATGFDVQGSIPTVGGQPDLSVGSTTGGGTIGYDTSTFRTGLASRYSTAASTTANAYFTEPLTITFGNGQWTRFYVLFSALPTGSNVRNVFAHAHSAIANGFVFRLNGSTLEAYNIATSSVVGSSPTVSASTWYRVEFYSKIVVGSTDEFSWRLDGTEQYSGTGLNLGDLSFGTAMGQCPYNYSTGNVGTDSITVYFDDYVLHDSSGSANNSWVGPGKVALAAPISDNQVGSWTGGVGGTSNLYDAVNNFPPAGTATETDTTQIERNAQDSGTTEYRANLTTYTNLGVGASDTVRAVIPWCNHGEDINTNTKTGSFGMQSNPSQSYATFTYGNDSGAVGTYTSQWIWSASTIIENPSVTKGSSPVIAVTKTDGGSRVGSVDSLFAYVAWETAAAATSLPLRNRNLSPLLRM